MNQLSRRKDKDWKFLSLSLSLSPTDRQELSLDHSAEDYAEDMHVGIYIQSPFTPVIGHITN